jgi:hypothetical protein
MIQSTPAERYPKVSYMRPEGTMEYYTDQTRPDGRNLSVAKADRSVQDP